MAENTIYSDFRPQIGDVSFCVLRKMRREFLSRRDIDRKAEEVLGSFDPKFPNNQISPIYLVVHGLAGKHQISFRFEQDLGFSPRGRKILGQFEFAQEQLPIDRILQYDSPRFRWTLCHEIGHWVLHRFIDPRAISRDRSVFVDTREQLHFTAQWSELRWIEWQANQFASSLLLPRPVLQRRALIGSSRYCCPAEAR
jgi:hypothetical protein